MTGDTNVHDAPISALDKNIMEFFQLTRNALDLDNDEAFFSVLRERNVLFCLSEQLSFSLTSEYVAKMIFVERKILERLKSERKKIIKDIDNLSRQINIVKAYSARFPIPSMPVFFDQTG
jgi:hypothetical protein